jgi:transposase InsO family protein
VEKHREEHRVARMCSAIEVSRAGYYAWRRQPQSARRRANEALSSEIAEIFDDSDQTYGAIRVHRTLRKRGDRAGLNRVARLMRERGLRVHRRRRYRPATTDSKHDHPIAPNRLQRDFTATRINERWVGDICSRAGSSAGTRVVASTAR